MKKLLLLVGLSLFLGLSVLSEVDIQKTCKEYREKVDEMVKTTASIHDQSIRGFLNQTWIDPIIEEINKQSISKEVDNNLEFGVYYASGITIALKTIDERLQKAQKKYETLLDFEKDEIRAFYGNLYEPLYIKNGNVWVDNLRHFLIRHFPPDYHELRLCPEFDIYATDKESETKNDASDKQTTSKQIQQHQDKIQEEGGTEQEKEYTINDLYQYLQKYVDCTQVTKEGETIKFTDEVKSFYTDNKLYVHEPQELADLLLRLIYGLDYYPIGFDCYSNGECPIGFAQDIRNLWDCGRNLYSGIHKNITLKEAFEEIKTAVNAWSPVKYDAVREELFKQEFKQDEESENIIEEESENLIDEESENIIDEESENIIEEESENLTGEGTELRISEWELADQAVERKLNYIMKDYANKLVEKANGVQNSLKKTNTNNNKPLILKQSESTLIFS